MLHFARVSPRRLFLVVAGILAALYLLNLYEIRVTGRSKLPWKKGPHNEHTLLDFKRQQSIREATRHAWAGYKKHAWGKDELQPVTQSSNLRWGDWAITLVDSLDTLKLVGLEEDYVEAKEYLRTVRFDRSPAGYSVSFFEMTIRALGGLLGAYELDQDPMLLEKAKQVGDSLAYAFDTPTGLPTSYVDVNRKKSEYSSRICIVEAGTLQLEFKKLSELTGDPKYSRYAERAQDAIESGKRKHEGLYPAYIFTDTGIFDGSSEYSMGAMSDSFYEYHLKQHILHNGKEPKFMKRYVTSVEAVKKMLVAKSESGYTYLGKLLAHASAPDTEMEHLACFYPGLLALGAQVLDRPQDLVLAEELARTCYASYEMTPTGLGPERFGFKTKEEAKVHNSYQLRPGSSKSFNGDGMGAADGRYILRPETVETLFVLYRVTGDTKYQEWGWNIFLAIEKHAKVEFGYAGVADVYQTNTTWNHIDAMESFFLAETLKYLYLLFSPIDVISLDEYVFNTEAHPFRIMK